MTSLSSFIKGAAIAFFTLLTGMELSASQQPAHLDEVTKNLKLTEMSLDELARVRITRRPVGKLTLPDGRLVAMDPLVMPERAPFTRRVQPGTYPLFIYALDAVDPRHALLEIRFSDQKVTRWELALIEGQDLATLKKGQIFGIGVDTGLAAFASSGFNSAMEQQEQKLQKENPQYNNYYDDVLADLMTGDNQDVLLHTPVSERPEAAVMIVRSGWGDGFYPVFFGLDEAGEPVNAVIEFFVAENADGRNPMQRAFEEDELDTDDDQQKHALTAYKAIIDGDKDTFFALLKRGTISPDMPIVEAETFIMTAAIEYKSVWALEALINHGAKNRLPENANLDPLVRWTQSQGQVGTYSQFFRFTKNSASPEFLAQTERLEQLSQ